MDFEWKMKRYCEEDSNTTNDAKIIDALYASENDTLSEETAGLKKTLSFWRESRVDETPPGRVKEKVLKEAERRKAGWKEIFLLPIRKPALGVGFVVICVLGSVILYNYGIKRSATPKKVQEEWSDQKDETLLALQDQQKESFRKRVRTSDNGEMEIETAQSTGGIPALPAEESERRERGSLGLDHTRTREREEVFEEKTVPRGLSARPGFAASEPKSNGTEKELVQDRETQEPAALDDPIDGDEVVQSAADEVVFSAFFKMAVKLLVQNEHKQAAKFFEKAYKEAANDRQRDLILLRWAQSEFALGRSERGSKLIRGIKNRQRWIKEIEQLQKVSGEPKKP